MVNKSPGAQPTQSGVRLQARFGRKIRDLNIVIGEEYVVEPMNPQKLKHRGRPCVVKGFVRDDIGTPVKVKVQFLDNLRPGRVDIDDLKAPGLTKERGTRRTVAPIPAGPAVASGGDLKATLNVLGLEGDLEELFQRVIKRLKEAEGSTDPNVVAGLLGITMLLEGMGSVLGVIGHHVEDGEARQRLVHLAQRFGGYKGAVRGVSIAASHRIKRTRPKH